MLLAINTEKGGYNQSIYEINPESYSKYYGILSGIVFYYLKYTNIKRFFIVTIIVTILEKMSK